MADKWKEAPLIIRLWSASLRRVSHATGVTQDALLVVHLYQNVADLLAQKDPELQDDFFKQDSALTGTPTQHAPVLHTY